MLASTSRTRHRSRWRGVLTLALVLSVGVVGFLSLVNTIFGQTAGGTGQGVQGILITALAAVIAVFLGLRLASRMGLDRTGATATLNKAAVVSLIFTALLTPAALLLMPSAGTALAGGALGAGAGIGGQLLNGLAGALLGQVVGLPLLFVTLVLLGYLQASGQPSAGWRGRPGERGSLVSLTSYPHSPCWAFTGRRAESRSPPSASEWHGYGREIRTRAPRRRMTRSTSQRST